MAGQENQENEHKGGSSTETFKSWIERLSNSLDPTNRATAARECAESGEVLARLSKDLVLAVVLAVAKNQNTPPSILENLSHSQKASLRLAVARNKKTTTDTLKRLLSDTEIDVVLGAIRTIRSRVPAERRLYPDEIVRFADSPDPGRRIAAAVQRLVPESILEKLSQDSAPVVRQAAARNKTRRAAEGAHQNVAPDKDFLPNGFFDTLVEISLLRDLDDAAPGVAKARAKKLVERLLHDGPEPTPPQEDAQNICSP